MTSDRSAFDKTSFGVVEKDVLVSVYVVHAVREESGVACCVLRIYEDSDLGPLDSCFLLKHLLDLADDFVRIKLNICDREVTFCEKCEVRQVVETAIY